MRGAAAAVFAAMSVAVASTPACLGPSDFHCTTHAQCGDVTSGSFCEVNGHCSVPDADCPLSGRRYVEHAGSDSGACLARACQDNPVAALAAGSDARVPAAAGRHGRVLGPQRRRPARRRHADAARDGGRGRRARRRDRHRRRRSAHLRRAHGRLGRLLGWRRRGPARRRRRRAPPDADAGRGRDRRARGRCRRRLLVRAAQQRRRICWGADGAGQLGDGGAGATTQPPDAGRSAASRRAGDRRTLAARLRARDDDTVWCWGANDDGQLGDGTTTDRPTPVARARADRHHRRRRRALRTAARRRAAEASAAGATTATASWPAVRRPSRRPSWCRSSCKPSRVAAGDRHTCAVRPDGAVYCWGANDHGQLGDGTTSGLPVQVGSSGARPSAIVSGGAFSCAITADGAVFCWGDNHFGQLGTGGDASRPTPVRPCPASMAAAAISRRRRAHLRRRTPSSPARRTPATLALCWGANEHGQLGDGRRVDRPTPSRRPPSELERDRRSPPAARIPARSPPPTKATWSAGARRRRTARARALAGRDAGHAASVDGAAVRRRQSRVRVIAAGGAHTCVNARSRRRRSRCFGANDHGQLGDGATPPLPARRRDAGAAPATATSAAAGAAHSCALDDDGRVWCWGRGDEGQLGDGARVRPAGAGHGRAGRPAQRAGGRGGRRPQLRARRPTARSCAGGAGRRASWATGGNTRTRCAPTGSPDIEGAPAVAAGGRPHLRHRRPIGTAAAGAPTTRPAGRRHDRRPARTPAPVAGPDRRARAVRRRGRPHCALRADGTLSCWGADTLRPAGRRRRC